MTTLPAAVLGAWLAAPAAAAVVPVAHGPVVEGVRARLGALLTALPPAGQTASLRGVEKAFRRSVAPTPKTPEGFAARMFVVEALSDPRRLPAMAASLEAAGGKKARHGAGELRALQAALEAAPAAERRSLVAAAAALHRSFGGTAAAPGEAIDFAGFSTVEDGGMSKKRSQRRIAGDVAALRELQKEMYAEGDRAVLTVFDGPDTAGKGGVIDSFSGLNLSWARTHAFKKPTPEEFQQHFLERVAKAGPQPGESKYVFFDRGPIEDSLVPTVAAILHAKDPKRYGPPKFTAAEVARRPAETVAWERELAARGVLIRKVYLHESREVQRERLQDRMDKPLKRWKLAPGKDGSINDLAVHENFEIWRDARGPLWAQMSTWWAPLTIVGADHEPSRNAAVVRLVRKAVEHMGLRIPLFPDLDGVRVPK